MKEVRTLVRRLTRSIDGHIKEAHVFFMRGSCDPSDRFLDQSFDFLNIWSGVMERIGSTNIDLTLIILLGKTSEDMLSFEASGINGNRENGFIFGAS